MSFQPGILICGEYKGVHHETFYEDIHNITFTDEGSRAVMTELKGKKNRTTNLVLVISDGVEEDNTEEGNLVGTFGNCGISAIFTKQKDTTSCSFPKRKKRKNSKK